MKTKEQKLTKSQKRRQTLEQKAYKYFLLGLNSKEIAAILGISYRTVQDYMSKGKWKEKRKITAKQIKMLELFEVGYSYKEIAKIFGVSKTTVYNYLHKARQFKQGKKSINQKITTQPNME